MNAPADTLEKPLAEATNWPPALAGVMKLVLPSPFPIFVLWGPERTFLYNEAYAPILGGQHPAALGKPFREVWPEAWAEIEPFVDDAFTGSAQMVRNYPFDLHRDGQLRRAYFTFAYSPILDEAGQVAGVFCPCTETTQEVERAGAEAALRESEARFRSMADITPAPVWVTGAAGPVEFVNQTFVEFAGMSREELLGDAWVRLVHPDDVPGVVAQRQKARETFEPYVFEARFRHACGEWRILQASSRPRFDDTGRFAGYVGLAMDVTEIRGAESRQRLLINELNHRVKNTLAAVQSVAHQSLRDGLPVKEARNLLTDRLLALSAAHNVLTQESWEGAELSHILAEALRPFGDLGRIEVTGDSVWVAPKVALAFSMALHELATNAVKYGALSTAQGKVTVETRVTDEAVELTWRESGGPAVEPPARSGFGLRLLERGLAAELGGASEVAFAREGVVCTLRARRGAGA